MSAVCQAGGCQRAIPDDHFACPVHWHRLSIVTRDRLSDPGTANGYLDAFSQAQLEIRVQPRLIPNRGQR